MKLLGLGLVLVLFTLGCAPKAEVLDTPITAELQAGQEKGQAQFDHGAFDRLLQSTVDPKTGFVSYTKLSEQRASLEAYLATVAKVDLRSLNRNEQLALLINAYNGYTLLLILGAYPGIESIRDLEKPWETKAYPVGGHVLSLNDIEHGLLRPIFKEPRIHFAVNCASKGCPPLSNRAFTGGDVDAQLTTATQRTLRDPRHAYLKDGRLHLTKILSWYGGDFVDESYNQSAESIPKWVAKYANEDVVELTTSKNGAPLSWIDYDWSLNDSH